MRGTGKTLDMVRHLPDAGAVVVVHSDDMRSYVRAMIADVRGRSIERATRVVVVNSLRHADRTLRGFSPGTKPVVDHAFWRLVDVVVAAHVGELLDVNYRQLRREA